MGRIDSGIDVPLFSPFCFFVVIGSEVNLIAAIVTQISSLLLTKNPLP